MGLKWECPADQTCSRWAILYFMDCICSQRDMISFFLGVSSIVCWAVAEIPHILVNWRSGNVEGLSWAFIFTWMSGDILNLLGCWISPGTLPTQFYLAVLYSSTSLLLVVEQIRFRWTLCQDFPNWASAETLLGRRRRRSDNLEDFSQSDSNLSLTSSITTQSLPVMGNIERPLLHVTASLPVSPYSREPAAHLGSLPALPVPRSPDSFSGSWRRLVVSNSLLSGNAIGSPMLHRGLMFSSLGVLGVTSIALTSKDLRQGFKQGVSSLVGGERRQLLQQDEDIAQSVGLILGWLMTCIYLTGRLPQIVLNWSRDFVIGVSVPTVVCALLGNATYLGSILVRGVEWSKLKPVLPWVVDIAFCLFMDCFMTLQFLIRHLKDGHTILE